MWQAAYSVEVPAVAHSDAPVQKAQAWLFKNFRAEVRVEDLAARVAMSPRTFARRFKAATGNTPIEYVHRLRVNAAKHLLENEVISVQDVRSAVGYGDVIFFRRLFKRYTGVAPRQYRIRFGVGQAVATSCSLRPSFCLPLAAPSPQGSPSGLSLGVTAWDARDHGRCLVK